MVAIRESGRADQHPDDAHRVAERGGPGILADPMPNDPDDDFARPDRGLERRGNDEQYIGQPSQLRRDGGVAADDIDRGGEHEEDAGLGQRPPDDSLPAETVGVRGGDAAADPAHHHHQSDNDERHQHP